MSRNRFRCFLVVSLIALSACGARALDDLPLFHMTDSLAPRDEWGVLHQMARVRPTDYAYRESFRPNYYWRSRRELLADPAYVAALQVCLRNRGYYCGPIDGYYTEAVSEAIARMQKNFTLPVTGTLTVAVRRGLRLP
jgi:hypothetical protein